MVTGRSENWVHTFAKLLFKIVLILGILYAGYRLRAIIATIIIAAIIAYMLEPMVEWLTRQQWFHDIHAACGRFVIRFQAMIRRTPPQSLSSQSRVKLKQHTVRTYATLYVFVLFFAVVWNCAKLVTRPFADQVRSYSGQAGQVKLQNEVDAFIDRWDASAPEFAKSEKIEGVFTSEEFAKRVQTFITNLGQKIIALAPHIVEAVIMPVLAFYFLIDGHKLKKEFVGLVPRPRMREALWIVGEFNAIMRSFVIGQFILCLLAGVVVGVGLWALQVPYAAIMGLLAGLTRAIPIVGPIIGGIPIILLTYIEKGPTIAIAVLGFFTFLHFAESKFIMPLLIGDRMELHPVVIIVVLIVGGEFGSMLIGGALGALLGMFFAAPVASIVRVLIRRYWLHIKPHNPKHQQLAPSVQ